MKVVKQSGEIVYFDRDKLKRSLQHSGARIEKIDEILEYIERQDFFASRRNDGCHIV